MIMDLNLLWQIPAIMSGIALVWVVAVLSARVLLSDKNINEFKD